MFNGTRFYTCDIGFAVNFGIAHTFKIAINCLYPKLFYKYVYMYYMMISLKHGDDGFWDLG